MTRLLGAPTVSHAADADLVCAFQGGDEEALVRLLNRHWAGCNRVALAAVHDPAAAEDAAQEAFTKLVSTLSKGQAPEQVGPWLRGVTLNQARMQRRADRRRSAREERIGHRRGLSEGPGNNPFARLRELTGELPEDLRLALELHFGLGYTHAEIGSLVGCPTGTASSRIRRGLKKVRAKLGASGVGPLAAGMPPTLLDAMREAFSKVGPLPTLEDIREHKQGLQAPAGQPVAPAFPARSAAASTLGQAILLALGLGLATFGAGALLSEEAAPAPDFELPSGVAAISSRVAQRSKDRADGSEVKSDVPLSRDKREDADPESEPPPVENEPAASPPASGQASQARDPDDPVEPTRLPKTRLRHHGLSVGELSLSTDRRHALSITPYELRIWDLVEMRLLKRIHPAELVPALRGTPDPYAYFEAIGFLEARACAFLLEQHLFVLDIPSGEVLKVWAQGEYPPEKRWLSLPGTRMLYAPKLGLFFDPLKGETEPGPLAENCQALAWSHDGQVLASLHQEGDTPWLSLWRRMGSKWVPRSLRLPKLSGHSHSLTFSPCGEQLYLLALEGGSSFLKLDVITGVILAETEEEVNSLLPTEDGRLFTSWSRLLHERDPQTLRITRSLNSALGILRPSLGLAVLANGNLLVVDKQTETIRLWDMDSGKELGPIEFHEPIQQLAFSPDGSLLVTAHRRGEVGVWDPRAGNLVRGFSIPWWNPESEDQKGDPAKVTTQPPVPRALGLSFHGEHTLLLATGRKGRPAVLHRVDLSTGSQLSSSPLGSKDEGPYRVAFAKSAPRLLVATKRRSFLLATPDLTQLGGDLPRARAIAISADGSRVALSHPNLPEVMVMEGESGAVVRRLTLTKMPIRLALSPEGNILLSSRWGTLRAWDLQSGQELWARSNLHPPFRFTADGRCVIASFPGDSDRTDLYPNTGMILALNPRTGATLAKLMSEGPYQDIRCIAVSPKGILLAGGSKDGHIYPGSPLIWPLEQTLRETGAH